MGRKKTYTEDQLRVVKQYYRGGEWEKIMPAFPGKTKADIRAIARKNGVRRERQKDTVIIGKTYGELTALHRIEESKTTKWRCRCSCGNETTVSIYSLTKGQVKSCGCLKHKSSYNAKDHTGKRFGLLVAVERLPRYRGNQVFYRCICDCGEETFVYSGNLTSGHTIRCGRKCHRKKEFEILKYDLDDRKKTYCIYRHISPNGKSYVGITSQTPERRFQNGNGYKTQKAFYRAIEKYGWDSFKHEIIEEGLTEKEAYEKEEYYIREVYKCFAPAGYNTREGGIHGRHQIMPVIQYCNGEPVNYFEGMGRAVKEIGICAYSIKRYTGEKNAIEGYYFEILPPIMPYNVDLDLQGLEDKAHYRIKEIIGENKTNTTIERNIAGIKPINQYALDGRYLKTYPSVDDAAEKLGVKVGGIYAAANPDREGDNGYGFMWRYDTGNHDNIEPISYKYRKSVLKVDKKTGDVIHEYLSVTEAAHSFCVSNNKIKYACNGKDSFDTFYLRYKTRCGT